MATAVFDHVSLAGRLARAAPGPAQVASGRPADGARVASARVHQAGGRFTVTGSGDIAPGVPRQRPGRHGAIGSTSVGTFAGLIAVIVVGAHVHHRRVPARPDPHHAGRQPAARPGAGGQGHRDRRGHASPPGWSAPAIAVAARRPAAARPTASTCLAGAGARPRLRVIVGTAALLGRGRGPRPRRRRHAAAQRRRRSPRHRGHRAAVPPGRRSPACCRPAWRTGCCGSPRPPRFADPAGAPAVPAGHRDLHARQRVLPAARRGPGSPCCAPGPRRARPGRSRCAGGTHDGVPRPTTGQARWGSRDALHAEWTKLRTVAGPGVAAARPRSR